MQKIFLLGGILLILFSASCGPSDISQSTVISTASGTEPVHEISADRPWQGTGVRLRLGETIQIKFVAGEIQDGEAIIRGPMGAGWAYGETDCCEPMPFEPRDALIGRVGDNLFVIGDQNEITAPPMENCSFGSMTAMRACLIIQAVSRSRFQSSRSIFPGASTYTVKTNSF